MNIIKRYLPRSLSRRDRTKQRRAILASRRAYKQGRYIARPKVRSFHSHESAHITRAKRRYKVDRIGATAELARKTRCSISALRKILNKGRGAYYSSGSRPNQTAESWARARLASALTGGKAAKVDRKILQEGCQAGSPAL
jgi:hypothetical protein